MKVSELIEKLQTLDGDVEIIAATDDECNAFRSIDEVWGKHGVPTAELYNGSLWRVPTALPITLTDEMKEHGFTEEDTCEPYGDFVPVVVLW